MTPKLVHCDTTHLQFPEFGPYIWIVVNNTALITFFKSDG